MNPTDAADFAMQAFFISACAWSAAHCLKRAERMARMALIGILACGVLPWFSSMIPVRRVEIPKPQMVRMEQPAFHEIEWPVVPMAGVPAPAAETIDGPSGTPVATRWKPDPAQMLWIAWVGGILAGLVFMIRELWITRRWIRSLAEPDDGQWQMLAPVLPHGLARGDFRISLDGPGPCVAGFLKPVVVTPAWLLEGGCERELGWALRHEQEHLRGEDTRWVPFIRLVRCVLWWNPFVHLLARVWDQSRERVCDLQAIREVDEVPDYGRFLLAVAGRNPERIAAASMACGRPALCLRRRIETLLKSGSVKPGPVGAGWSVAAGSMLLGLSVFSAGFGFANEKIAETKNDGDLSWLEPKPVLEIRATAIVSAQALARNGESMTLESAKSMIARAKKLKDTHVMSLGNGVVVDGRTTTLQISANRDGAMAEPPWNGEKQTDDFVGWVLHAETDGVELSAKLAYAFAPGSHPAPAAHIPQQVPRLPGVDSWMPDFPQILPPGVSWREVKFTRGDCKCPVESDQAVVLSLGEVERGVQAICLIEWRRRMPWQTQRLLDETDLVAGRSNQIRVETRTMALQPTEEQKREYEELRRESIRLETKVEQLPENRNLLKLRKGLEDELRHLPDNDEARGRIQWKIDAVSARMRENCPVNHKVEIQEVLTRRSRLNARLVEDFMKAERQKSKWPLELRGFEQRLKESDPTKFNHQEQ